jgi:hypothetical protein
MIWGNTRLGMTNESLVGIFEPLETERIHLSLGPCKSVSDFIGFGPLYKLSFPIFTTAAPGGYISATMR